MAPRVVDAAARESYGRLLALLSARSDDLADAEDALGEALLRALRRWPAEGVPASPEGWLLVTARRALVDGYRRRTVSQRAIEGLAAEAREGAWDERDAFPDERLRLLCLCAHPAVDPGTRTPLMLATVFGLEAERIAGLFLVSPAAMAGRLVRAKARLRELGIVPETPRPDELRPRLDAVLETIYAAYGAHWDTAFSEGVEPFAGPSLVGLARGVAAMLPDEPEALGLLALLLSCEARSPARRTPLGEFVPLDEQDPALWNRAALVESEAALRRAAALGRPGRFQWEAAIGSAHIERMVGRRTGGGGWAEVVALYEALVLVSPTIGALVGRAVARMEAGDAARGLAELDALPPERVATYGPYWAARSEATRRLGRTEDAVAAADRAIGLATDPAVRQWLQLRRSGLRAVAEGG